MEFKGFQAGNTSAGGEGGELVPQKLEFLTLGIPSPRSHSIYFFTCILYNKL